MGIMSVRELNANISRALAMVEAGETLDITRNGKVVAELRPKPIVRDEAWWRLHEASTAFLEHGVPLGLGKVTEQDKYGDADR
ncbi:MAG: hypothetical protein B7Y45_08835 [Sphingomonas sp. 28-66-16]|nr:MAG: hypothetical protein B7Y45_08835 [Sphingomonas sp. 28-66-16]